MYPFLVALSKEKREPAIIAVSQKKSLPLSDLDQIMTDIIDFLVSHSFKPFLAFYSRL